MFQATAYAPNRTTARPAVHKPTPKQIAERLSVGIVLHDNQTAMAEGWAFRPGEKPVRVRGLYDLPNDSMWISSGDFNDFRKLGGAQFHHVRRTGYLGLKLTEIATDLGIRIDGGHALEGGNQIAEYVQASVRLAVETYKIEDPLRQLQEDTLVSTLTKLLPPPMPSREMFTAKLASAYQGWSSRYVSFMDNTALVRLRFSRLPYAQWLLSQQVPDNGWSHIFSNQGFDHEAVMAGTFAPTLIEAVVEFDQINSETAELIAYGAGGATKTRSKRAWMTDVEYRWISQHARVHVQTYLVSTALQPLPAAALLPDCLVEDEMLSMQPSVGLVSYCHWQSLLSSKWNKLTSRAEYDINATWLRAHDRAKCFEAAFLLQQKGFHVSGYGSGSIAVRAERSRIKELIEVAMDIGIAYPRHNALLEVFGYASPDDTY
jgi:hypothetical protein